MSKKTKKEKIASDIRKQILFARQPENAVQEPSLLVLPVKNQPASPIQSQSLYIYPVHLIKKDLTKTLLLSILAISFEIALYFLL
jgi:hypothetical protein